MSRPQKMHKPLKGSFTEIINAVADGRGVRLSAKTRALQKGTLRASLPPAPKKP